jgi:Ca2+-transporting ATPase
MAAFLVARGPLDLGPHQAVTVSFLGLAFGRTWHVFNMRRNDSGVFWNEVTRNPWVWAAVGLSVVLLLAAVMVPPLSLALRTAWPGAAGWLTLFAASLVPLATVQAGKAIRRATRSTG